MYKIEFFVSCNGWNNGGYYNAQYFKTKKNAIEWATIKNVKIISIVKISEDEFAEDFIGEL